MPNNLATIAYRAYTLSRLEELTGIGKNNIARWISLYSAVKGISLQADLSNLLRSAWLSGIVTAVETALNDTLKEVLTAYPLKLGKKQVTVQELVEFPSNTEVIRRMAEEVVNELSYKNAKDYLAQWQNYAGKLSALTEGQILTWAEIKATRDVYTHNNGKRNEIYKRKAGVKARREDNNGNLPVDEPYLTAASHLAADIVDNISSSLTATFSKCTKEAVFREMWDSTCCGEMVSFDKQWNLKKSPHRNKFKWAWSHSEKAMYDVFLRIFHGESPDISTDIHYALRRWPANTNEGAVIRSWIENPFFF